VSSVILQRFLPYKSLKTHNYHRYVIDEHGSRISNKREQAMIDRIIQLWYAFSNP